MDSTAVASPRFTARMAGLCYLLMGVSGGLAVFARRGLIVSGDAAATAVHLLAHPSLYRLSFGGEILVVAFYLGVVALFHQLFKPVNRGVSLLAALFGLMGCAVQAGAAVFFLAPLTILGPAPYLNAFNVNQLQAQAYLYLKLYSLGYGVALVFFGFYGFLIGCLILKSTFLPRFIGVMMALAGLAWLSFLAPGFAAEHLPWIMPFAIGEGLLMLWLLVKGVDPERWIAQANARAEGALRP